MSLLMRGLQSYNIPAERVQILHPQTRKSSSETAAKNLHTVLKVKTV
jgi:hypothetical protein